MHHRLVLFIGGFFLFLTMGMAFLPISSYGEEQSVRECSGSYYDTQEECEESCAVSNASCSIVNGNGNVFNTDNLLPTPESAGSQTVRYQCCSFSSSVISVSPQPTVASQRTRDVCTKGGVEYDIGESRCDRGVVQTCQRNAQDNLVWEVTSYCDDELENTICQETKENGQTMARCVEDIHNEQGVGAIPGVETIGYISLCNYRTDGTSYSKIFITWTDEREANVTYHIKLYRDGEFIGTYTKRATQAIEIEDVDDERALNDAADFYYLRGTDKYTLRIDAQQGVDYAWQVAKGIEEKKSIFTKKIDTTAKTCAPRVPDEGDTSSEDPQSDPQQSGEGEGTASPGDSAESGESGSGSSSASEEESEPGKPKVCSLVKGKTDLEQLLHIYSVAVWDRENPCL